MCTFYKIHFEQNLKKKKLLQKFLNMNKKILASMSMNPLKMFLVHNKSVQHIEKVFKFSKL